MVASVCSVWRVENSCCTCSSHKSLRRCCAVVRLLFTPVCLGLATVSLLLLVLIERGNATSSVQRRCEATSAKADRLPLVGQERHLAGGDVIHRSNQADRSGVELLLYRRALLANLLHRLSHVGLCHSRDVRAL